MKIIKSLLSILISAAMLNIPAFAASAEEELLFKTDFDSYQIWDDAAGAIGETVQEAFAGNLAENRTYAGGKISADQGAFPEGLMAQETDDGHGTVLSIDDSQRYQIMWVEVPAHQKNILLSFDFKMPVQGRLFVNGDSFNFGLTLEGPNLRSKVADQKPGEDKLFENVIDMQKWSRVEVFLNYTAETYIIYVNDEQLGRFEMPKNVPLQWITFRKPEDGTMYVDNIEVKQASLPPHLEDLTASLKAGSVNAQSDSITIDFNGEIDKDSVTADNIKIYDETNEKYLDCSFSEIGSASVTVSFDGALKQNCDYTVEFYDIMDVYGQVIKTKALSFNTNVAEATGRTPVLSCDFDSYRIGEAELVNRPFVSLAEYYMGGVMRADANGDGIVGEVIDENYGTSMKMTAGDWRNIDIILSQQIKEEFIVSLDLKMVSSATIRLLTNYGADAQACISGTSAKPEMNTESTVEYVSDVLKFNEWTPVEIYVNPEKESFAFYINGKMIGDEHPFYDTVSRTTSIQLQKSSGGDVYIDNLSVDIVSEPPHSKPIQMSLSLENSVMPEGERSLYLQFSDIMNVSRLTADAITVSEITDNNAVNVPFELSEVTSRRVKITLLDELKKEASYRITLADTVTGGAGNALAVNHINFFPYSEELRVNNVEFTDYSGNTTDNTEIPPEIKYLTIYFNKPVEQSEINGNVAFTDENNAAVPAKIRYISDKNAVRITPSQMLRGGSTYNLSVGAEILGTEYKKTFTTLEGSFAKGSITVNDLENKISGSFAPGETVTVKADIINTAFSGGNYTVLVGEYSGGKLSAYHLYDESIEQAVTYQTKEYNVNILSQSDEIRAFVWENPQKAQPLRRTK